jgi:predicted transcriptional regulator
LENENISRIFVSETIETARKRTMEKELTRLELRLMNILWDKRQAFVNDIIEVMPTPKPAYSTISTMMRILVQKGYAGFESLGKSHRYHPLVSREEYSRAFLRSTRDNLFGGSCRAMISCFAQTEKLSPGQIAELVDVLGQEE